MSGCQKSKQNWNIGMRIPGFLVFMLLSMGVLAETAPTVTLPVAAASSTLETNAVSPAVAEVPIIPQAVPEPPPPTAPFTVGFDKINAGDTLKDQIVAAGKHVVVIGGGDTGSDCVGTSNRQGAASIKQFELMPQPPEIENKPMVWPYWPTKLRTSSSHEEGCERDWAVATKRFEGRDGKVEKLIGCRVEWNEGKMQEVPNSEFEMQADLVLLAMGFVSPVGQVLDAFGVEKDTRGNAKATTDGDGSYKTSASKVFAAGDIRRGQSLVVWAIREGRQCARAVDEFLMGSSVLPR